MSWKMLYNGNCPPPGPEPFKFVYSFSGSDNQIAIDNQGRMFTWGTSEQHYTGQTPVLIAATSNFLPHPAIVNGGAGSGLQIHYPYQVGNTGGWKNAKIYYSMFLAQDSENYLYAWGDGWWGQGGWDTTAQYDQVGPSASRTYNPGGEYALLPTKVNNLKWLDFGTGSQHVIALGEDKRAYVWGTNSNARVFGMPEYVEDQKTLIPVLVNTLPDTPLKIVSAADECNLVVTESDQIYAWGIFSWSPIVTIPELVPLAVPAGTTIKQAIATSQGIVILLTNGDVYCRGYRIQFAPGPDWYAATLTKIPGDHFFTYISAYENEVGALDNAGNIWGWGAAKEFISRDDTFCNQAVYLPTEEPVFVASPTLGARQFTYFSVGNTSHCGIDTQGRLFCWGFDLWGQLGVNNLPVDHSCSPLQVYNPTLADGTLAYNEVVVGATAATITAPLQLPQLLAHNPCGHWHTFPSTFFDENYKSPDYPMCCWQSGVGITNDKVLYIVTGMQQPHIIVMLNYIISVNRWYQLYTTEHVFSANWQLGAALDGDVFAFHNYTYESPLTGETFSNPQMRTIVWSPSAPPPENVNEKLWPGTTELDGKGRIAVTNSGIVMAVTQDASNWRVEVSTNFGATYTTRMTLSKTADRTDVKCAINDAGHLFLAVLDKSAAVLITHRSTNAGVAWSVMSTKFVIAAPLEVEFSADVDNLFACIRGQEATRFYYSNTDGATWAEALLREPSIHFAASGDMLYNLTQQEDYRTEDYTASTIAWQSQIGLPVSKTVVDRCTIRNHGDVCVYAQPQLRVQLPFGSVVSILIGTDLGKKWREIQTPFQYFATFEETLHGADNPIWPFTKQENIFARSA